MIKMKRTISNQNDNSGADSIDNGYVTAEEETLEEFHESHQYVRWELPPNATEFYPMSSLFALHGIPYKFKSSLADTSFESTNDRKKSKLKKTWVKRFLRERKNVSSALRDYSNTPHHPGKQKKN